MFCDFYLFCPVFVLRVPGPPEPVRPKLNHFSCSLVLRPHPSAREKGLVTIAGFLVCAELSSLDFTQANEIAGLRLSHDLWHYKVCVWLSAAPLERPYIHVYVACIHVYVQASAHIQENLQ